MRNEKLKQLLKKSVNKQTICVYKEQSSKLSYYPCFLQSITYYSKKEKPFEDGELSFVEAANCIFDCFRNKSEILNVINSFQLSARTIARWVETMSEYVTFQLNKYKLIIIYIFSLQLYESLDISYTCQLAMFVGMMFNDFTVKEEFLKVILLQW